MENRTYLDEVEELILYAEENGFKFSKGFLEEKRDRLVEMMASSDKQAPPSFSDIEDSDNRQIIRELKVHYPNLSYEVISSEVVKATWHHAWIEGNEIDTMVVNLIIDKDRTHIGTENPDYQTYCERYNIDERTSEELSCDLWKDVHNNFHDIFSGIMDQLYGEGG